MELTLNIIYVIYLKGHVQLNARIIRPYALTLEFYWSGYVNYLWMQIQNHQIQDVDHGSPSQSILVKSYLSTIFKCNLKFFLSAHQHDTVQRLHE